EVVDRLQVGGIRHGDVEEGAALVAADRQGKEAVPATDLGRNLAEHGRRDGLRGEIDLGHAKLARERPHHRALGGEAHGNEDLAQLPAPPSLMTEGRVELQVVDDAVGEEDLAESGCGFVHQFPPSSSSRSTRAPGGGRRRKSESSVSTFQAGSPRRIRTVVPDRRSCNSRAAGRGRSGSTIRCSSARTSTAGRPRVSTDINLRSRVPTRTRCRIEPRRRSRRYTPSGSTSSRTSSPSRRGGWPSRRATSSSGPSSTGRKRPSNRAEAKPA